jgi:predicted metal-dependent phosphoesterase TrpH
MIRVDFHTHTADDPIDRIPYTTIELIDRAASLGFGALAITLHDRQRRLDDIAAYARARGIVLIAGVERTIQGRHVLLLNFPDRAQSVESFAQLESLKRQYPDGCVIAPHPRFPHPTCLGALLERHADLFDAVELNACYTRWVDFNQAAIGWARRRAKPIVANSDAHRLAIFGASCSLVDARPSATAICAAVKAGRVRCETRPLTAVEVARYLADLMLHGRHATDGTGVGERVSGAIGVYEATTTQL